MPLCVITGRTNSATECFEGRAGISHLYINSATNVTDLTFDAERLITAITVDATVGKGFRRFEFDEDTAFLNETLTRAANGRGGNNVAVSLSLNIAGRDAADLNALENLSQFRNLHIIVVDNNGKMWYVGISYNETTDTWKTEGLRTADGSANSGADPTNDLAEIIQTFACNQSWYSRQYTGLESAIALT